MIRPRDKSRADQIQSALSAFDAQCRRLPGIAGVSSRQTLIEQILESIHRVEYVTAIRRKTLSPMRLDPTSELFDPLRAAIILQNNGAFDEACWMVFIFVHFGKSGKTGWRLARDVYGALGGQPWNWDRISANANAFPKWLSANQMTLSGRDGVNRRFGNHRKYQSIDATSPTGTGSAFTSYIEWIRSSKTHRDKFDESLAACGNDPRLAFDHLFQSMSAVSSFGRTAKFDYLTMIGKLRLAAIEPGSPYFQSSTGPIDGARLLFGNPSGGRYSVRELDLLVTELGNFSGLNMQVMEDALCNWQKSPTKFIPFRG